MSLDGEGIKAVQEGYKPRLPITMQVEGRETLIVPNGWAIQSSVVHTAQPLALQSLSSIRDYVDSNVDSLAADKVLLHVVSPTAVHLVGALGSEDDHFRRITYAVATAQVVRGAGYAAFHPIEQFIVWLQTGFAPSADRDRLLDFVGTIKESDARTTVDNGVTQEVATAKGIQLGRDPLPNPVVLAPYRTFHEVEQPASPFLLRARAGSGNGQLPTLALFEADGGKWASEAVGRISEWLDDNLTAKVSVIA